MSIQSIPRALLGFLLSRPSLQPLWEGLLKVCHSCMNVGGGYEVHKSGESFALKQVSARFRQTEVPVIFDIGANTGDYAKMAREVLESAHIYSFEPNAKTFTSLSASFSRDPKVTCEQVALGREAGTSTLYFDAANDLTGTLKGNELLKKEGARRQQVAVMTLDSFCEKRGIKRIDFMKIDTEGAEIDVLCGAREMLGSHRIFAIQFEFGETYVGSGFYFKSFWDLLSPDYRIYRVLKRGLYEIKCYSWECEIMKIANYIAILRNP